MQQIAPILRFRRRLSTGGGVTPPPAAIGLDLDFAGIDNSGTARFIDKDDAVSDLATLVTCSRSGSAWYFDSSGTLQEATSNVARNGAHYWNGSAWTLGGLARDTDAATQLLHGTDAFATQTETVTAQAYTLQMRGTGSIALTGAHTATLNGTGANDLVSLSFTPSAGTLTLTPSGTVNYPQLEAGTAPSSYIPNTAGSGSVVRPAETITIAGADMPYSTDGVLVQMQQLTTYADNDDNLQARFYQWQKDGNEYFRANFRTDGSNTGQLQILQRNGGGTNTVETASTQYGPGINVPMNFAARHEATVLQMAADGTAFTSEVTDGVPPLSTHEFEIGAFGVTAFIQRLRVRSGTFTQADIEDLSS